MKRKTSIFLVHAFTIFFLSQTGADGLNIPELSTTRNSTVYIPCNVDTETDYEYMTPIFWSRIGHDGIVQTITAPTESNFVPSSNVESLPIHLNTFNFLVVRNMTDSLSGTYTCHTDKGNASTLVHVLDDGTKPSCSENFDLVHGRCLYYSNEKKNWKDAHYDCAARTSILITFKDAYDLMSFLLNLQKSGPTHYEFNMWTGHAFFEERNFGFESLLNDAQVSPMLYKYYSRLISCGYLATVKRASIPPRHRGQCDTTKLNFLCEQPTL